MSPAEAEQHRQELRELWEQERVPTKEEVRRALGWGLIEAEREQNDDAS